MDILVYTIILFVKIIVLSYVIMPPKRSKINRGDLVAALDFSDLLGKVMDVSVDGSVSVIENGKKKKRGELVSLNMPSDGSMNMSCHILKIFKSNTGTHTLNTGSNTHVVEDCMRFMAITEKADPDAAVKRAAGITRPSTNFSSLAVGENTPELFTVGGTMSEGKVRTITINRCGDMLDAMTLLRPGYNKPAPGY